MALTHSMSWEGQFCFRVVCISSWAQYTCRTQGEHLRRPKTEGRSTISWANWYVMGDVMAQALNVNWKVVCSGS
jgi:hypothetical protein